VSDSIRQQIITALDTRLKTILVVNDYKTNAGQHVFDWEDRDLDDSELEAIIYRDPGNGRTQATVVEFDNKMVVEIEVKAKAGVETAKRIRKMIEDVFRAIGTDETWGGLADCTTPVGEKIDIQKSDKIIGAGTIFIEIEYRTEKWQY